MTEAGDEGLDSPCQIIVFLCLSHELSALFEPTAEAAAGGVGKRQKLGPHGQRALGKVIVA
jgi:hypothetical protein